MIIQREIMDGLRPVIPPPGPPSSNAGGMTESLRQLIQDCWDTDPEKRPSFERILQRLETVRRDILAWKEAAGVKAACEGAGVDDSLQTMKRRKGTGNHNSDVLPTSS